MLSLVKMSRILPLVYPEIFHDNSGASAGSPTPAAVAVSTSVKKVAGAGEADAAAAIHAKRLRSLHQRNLRNQGHSETLTYSGRLSA
ncbi:hypothetical protein [Geomonas sp.]|uniref:hypothetical protein n=1 Tax=Geomonas sp. TaxID=2651584 RepID=UPI002B4801F3|nr:hypothetical protein [Geomonas sp.]HJV34749.1 hypothetical protein [Geomonas sp.]